MGVIIHIPAFEIELPDSFGTTVQEVVTALPNHYKSFRHFLEENGGDVGTINIRGDETTFSRSIDFTWDPPMYKFKRACEKVTIEDVLDK